MTKVAIREAEWIDPEAGEVATGTVLVEDGCIAARLDGNERVSGDWEPVARPGLRMAPGFVDLHFHGELVATPPDHFAEALARDADRMLREGTTAFLATSVCWPQASLGDTVEALARAADALATGATCLGLHLEGPWISADAAGAMATDAIRPFDARADAEVLARAGERLRMVTLAPEVAGADALLAALVDRDVVAALGHTRASAQEIDAAVARGLRHVTHLWNAMGPLHHREPGVPGAVLANDRLSADLICDGHHVHPAVVRTTARTLGERLMLITDRVERPTQGAVASALGEAEPDGVDGPWRRADGTLVGSSLGLDGAVRNLRRFAEASLVEAIAACTSRPARLLGLEAERGTLRVGARADFACLDETGRVMETWLGGSPVFHADPNEGAAPR